MWFILALLAVPCIVFKNTFKKSALKNISEIRYLTIFYFFNFLIVLGTINQVDFDLEVKEHLLILLISFLFLFSLFFATKALKNLDLSYYQPLSALTPLFVMILSLILLGEILTIYSFIGVFILIIGCFLMISENKKVFQFKYLFSNKIALIFIAIFIEAINIVLTRFLLKSVSPVTFIFLSRAIIFFGFLLISSLFIKKSKKEKPLKKQAWLLIGLIAIVNFIAVYLYNLSLSYTDGKAALVSSVTGISLPLTILLGGKYLKEKFVFHRIWVSFLILFGLILISISA